MKNHRPIFLLLALILLTACGQTKNSLPAQATTQPAKPTKNHSATPTEGVRAEKTVMPPAAWSPTPGSTPAVLTPTITLDPNQKVTKQAYERTKTQIASYHATCDDFTVHNVLFSPNETWMAIHCGYKRNQTLEVISKEGKQWIFQFKDYIAPNFVHDGETGLGGLYPVHWTGDGQYLFFTSNLGVSGGGTCFYGFGAAGLFRLNVNTGTVSTILAPATDFLTGYEVAFSPGGGKLAYNTADHPVILDFHTGENTNIDPGTADAGDITWSPDGTALAFSTCRPSEDFYTIQKSSIKIYSLETQELKTILEVDKNFLTINQSTGNQKLEIVNTDIQTGKEEYIYFDWSTGQLSTPSPTTQP